MTDYFFKDHQPSAMECEARLRGLWRIISSKTVIAVNVPTRGGSGGREVFVHHLRWLPRSEGGTPSQDGRGQDARAPVIGRSAACGRDARALRGAGMRCVRARRLRSQGGSSCSAVAALHADETPAYPGLHAGATLALPGLHAGATLALPGLHASATLALPGMQGGATRSRAPALPDACSDKPVPHQGGR
jgi:hypothetical protein